MRVDSVAELMQYASKATQKRNPNLMTEAQEKPPKKAKYGNKKVEVDGYLFDSQREANYYEELKILKRTGTIKDFTRQVDFVLQDGFVNDEGKKVRPIVIRVDFAVLFPDGRTEVHDPKGFKTKEYQMKKKMFEKRYPDIKFVEI